MRYLHTVPLPCTGTVYRWRWAVNHECRHAQAVSCTMSALISHDALPDVAERVQFAELCVFIAKRFIDSLGAFAEVPVAPCARGFPMQPHVDRVRVERGRT